MVRRRTTTANDFIEVVRTISVVVRNCCCAGVQAGYRWLVCARRGVALGQAVPAQHFVSRAGPQRDAVGAGSRLQRRERAISFDLSEVVRALLLDEQALTGQQAHEARDDLRQQPLQRLDARGARLVEHRQARAVAIDSVEHQTVQVDIQIGGRAKPLDEGDGASVCVAVLYTRLLKGLAYGVA